jgi:hypothetical protein
MTAGREARTPNLTDHLPPTDALSGPDQIPLGVIEGCLDLNPSNAAVADEQPIPVRGAVVSPRHNSGIRRTYCGAAGGSEVGAVVQFPDLQHRMEPYAERRRHRARNWSQKPVASWPSDRGTAQPSRPRRSGRRPDLSCAFRDRALSLRNQTQLTTAIAEEKQRVEILLALAQSPMQATSTVPTLTDLAYHLPQRDALADLQCADHRLVRGADRTMVEADDRLAGDRSDECHCAVRRGKNSITRLGGKINPSMT